MVVTKKNLMMASVGIAMALNFSACKKDKAIQTDKLVGDWKLISIIEEDDPNDEFFIEDEYLVTFEFDANQDFSYCTADEDTSFCYTGNWEWSNDDETAIDITTSNLGGGEESFTFEIDKLTDDELEGDFNLVGDDENTKYKFKRVD